MKIDDYLLLLRLQEIGTIRGTARSVLISQPAITQRLKYIEEYFGMPIFIRTSKNLILTPAGEMILEHAKKIMDGEQRIKNSLAKTSDEVGGTLSIACSTLVSQRFLPGVLAEYTTMFPNVSIDLVTGLSEDIRRDHKNYHLNIIRGQQIKESTCDHLFDDPLYVFDTEPFPENVFKKRTLIVFKSDERMHDAVDDWLAHHQSHIQALKTIRVDQIETCKQFMKEGLGMAVLPQSVSESLMDDYPHMPLTLNDEYVTHHTWICYQEGVRTLPQVDAFIKALENEKFL